MTAACAVLPARRPEADPEDPVTQLLRAVTRGSEEAWRELLRRFSPWLFRVAHGCGLSASDAADVCQTTWMRLFEHLDRIRDAERIPAWLAATARNESWRLLRRRQREVLTADHGDLVLEEPSGDRSPEHHVLASERSTALRRAVQGLSPRHQRFVGMLMRQEPATYREIADATGMPMGSIGPTRARCLERLRATLDLAELRSA